MNKSNKMPFLTVQQQFCVEREVICELTTEDEKVGYALQTEGKLPINGLRHPRTGDASGWYIWCGEKYLDEPDFFAPLHARHLIEECPRVLKYLGLPFGYRFLIGDGDYEDIWFDPLLLNHQ